MHEGDETVSIHFMARHQAPAVLQPGDQSRPLYL
jgi:hypothetical protein